MSIAGLFRGAFAIWDGLAPANQVMHTCRTRLRITQKRGQQTQALAVTVNILDRAGDVLLRIDRIASPVRHGKGARGSGSRERMVPLINGADRTLRWFTEDVRGRFDDDHTWPGVVSPGGTTRSSRRSSVVNGLRCPGGHGVVGSGNYSRRCDG
ncbi:hypothetical protein ACTU45_23970 [Streptomyces sp. 24-1644]|uniref:hypothetical protein n=1 Tax=Streptomyces sp. 24-1644 TaxID=3457315 RepID=UPI003FA70AE8